jgi:ribosomal protein S18 acetylase RimI-like enzyme
VSEIAVDGASAVAHAFSRMAELGGGAALDGDGLLRYRTSSADPVVWNGALLTSDRTAPPKALELADAFFADSHRGYGFWIVASRDGEMARELRDAGLEQVADDPHMAASVDQISRPTEHAGHISVVTTDAGRRAFVACTSRAFATLGVDPATWATVYPSLASACQDDIVAVVADDGREPVAAAMGYLHDGVCQVIHVGTVPEAQRRGLGAAVTSAVVSEAAARGSTHAVLQATSLGEPVYQRLGFREIDRYQLFLRPHVNAGS